MADSQSKSPAFHVMVKPAGPACNLGCAYCFYRTKDQLLYGPDDRPAGRMSDELLDQFTREYIDYHRDLVPPGGEITFAWQGGEPTLLGVDFFRRAVELQRRHAPPGVRVANSFQTNGTLIDDEWAAFLAENEFLVGISLDGPRDLHDAYRTDAAGASSFDRVMAGLRMLQKHRADFNALVVVNRLNAARPGDVYRFLRDEAGVQFMQFIPCVERTDFETVAPGDWPIESTPRLIEAGGFDGDTHVTDWTVEPDAFGQFLCGVFDAWRARDIGRVFVQTFDAMLGQWMGLGSSLCVFAPTCGLGVAMEPDGAIYACDHYVYPSRRLGRLGLENRPIGEIVLSDAQRQFGQDKSDRLPRYCHQCPWLFACNGECPKNRFVRTPEGEPGLNYLCAGWRRFFGHIDPWMKRMATEVRAGRPAANVMQPATTRPLSSPRAAPPGPNAPCPCGSGRKFKKCCGRT